MRAAWLRHEKILRGGEDHKIAGMWNVWDEVHGR